MINNLLLTLADAAPAGGASPQSSAFNMLPFVLIAVIFYFLIIRPQQKRQKDLADLVASVKVGDEVVMNSGIHGFVSSVKDTTLMLKVADNVKIEFDKAAVASVTKSRSES